jgi:hypothetical protein
MIEISRIGIIFLGTLISYQLYVSIAVYRAEEYDRIQRIFQISLIWLVPLFGSIGCHLFLRSQRESVGRIDDGCVPQEPNGDP